MVWKWFGYGVDVACCGLIWFGDGNGLLLVRSGIAGLSRDGLAYVSGMLLFISGLHLCCFDAFSLINLQFFS